RTSGRLGLLKRKRCCRSSCCEYGRACECWNQLLHQLQSLSTHVRTGARQSGKIATWPRQTVDQFGTDRIAHRSIDDRNARRRLFRDVPRGDSPGQNEIDIETDQLGRKRWKQSIIAPRGAILVSDILALAVAELAQRLPECRQHLIVVDRPQYPDLRHTTGVFHRRLLRARRERPGDSRAAEKRDEVAASHHSITSSAATRRTGGTVSPSDLAVLRFIAVSNLVPACTGRLAGLSPRRMRST